MTGNQLIFRALRDIGCLRPGGGASTDTLNECLTALNEMIDSWLLDRLMVYAIVANAYTLTAGVQQYTIGPSGATFTAARPTRIENANIILNTFSPALHRPIGIIDHGEWSRIPIQALPFAIPEVLYYDHASTNGTLNLWPGPGASYQLELFTWQQLQSFADLITSYSFPPGYELALRKNLAVQIAPMMKVYFKIPEPLLEEVKDQARKAKAAIEADNSPVIHAECDASFLDNGKGGSFNYGTGLAGRRG